MSGHPLLIFVQRKAFVMDYQTIVNKNPHLAFLNNKPGELSAYGTFVLIPEAGRLCEEADGVIPNNLEQNAYVASEPALDTDANRKLFSAFFGGMEVQIGWVAGPNSTMNGMEYHKSNEVLIALSAQVLLLGLQSDMDPDHRFETTKAKALYLKKGDCFELFPQTLHLSPCKVSDAGFRTIIVLPKGTNLPLEGNDHPTAGGAHVDKDRRLLFMKNKWMLAHPERKPLVEKGVFPGLVGENVRVLY